MHEAYNEVVSVLDSRDTSSSFEIPLRFQCNTEHVCLESECVLGIFRPYAKHLRKVNRETSSSAFFVQLAPTLTTPHHQPTTLSKSSPQLRTSHLKPKPSFPTRSSSEMADSQLYEESFSITSVNSQKYDRVSRIAGSSSDMQTVMSLDVNSDLYPLQTGEGIQMLLASTLNLDGTKDERGWRDTKGTHEATLADMWDYVCYGKVYRFEEGEGENM